MDPRIRIRANRNTDSRSEWIRKKKNLDPHRCLGGHEPILRIPEAQLAMTVGAPGEHRPAHGGREVVKGAAGEAGQRHARQAVHQCRTEHQVVFNPEAELALAVAAPGEELAGGGEGGAVVHARAHRRHLQGINFSVADPGCLPRIPDPTFCRPGSRIRTVSIPDPGFASKNLSMGCSSGSRIRMLTFYPSRIPEPGVKKAPDPGSGSATLINFFSFLMQKG
jgi:hypothetical protein